MVDEVHAPVIAAQRLVSRCRQAGLLELLEQAVDVVGVYAPGLAEAHREAVREIPAMAGALEQQTQQRTPQRG